MRARIVVTNFNNVRFLLNMIKFKINNNDDFVKKIPPVYDCTKQIVITIHHKYNNVNSVEEQILFLSLELMALY